MSTPIDLSALRDRSCLITGGASGLGLATTTKFAAHGAYVTIADVQDDLGNEIVAKLTAEGQHVSYVHCDITDWESSLAAFKHAVEFSPSKTLNVVALYAGVGGKQQNLVDHTKSADPKGEPVAPTHMATDVNLIGSFYSTALALHYLQTTESRMVKSLILVASVAGYSKYSRGPVVERQGTLLPRVSTPSPLVCSRSSVIAAFPRSRSSGADIFQWTIPIQIIQLQNSPPAASSAPSALAPQNSASAST